MKLSSIIAFQLCTGTFPFSPSTSYSNHVKLQPLQQKGLSWKLNAVSEEDSSSDAPPSTPSKSSSSSSSLSSSSSSSSSIATPEPSTSISASSTTTKVAAMEEINTKMDESLIADKLEEGASAFSIFIKYYPRSFKHHADVDQETIQSTVKEIMDLCQKIESFSDSDDITTTTAAGSSLKLQAYKYGLYSLLQALMRMDYTTYVKVASFLSPLTIPREELPNVQDIPFVEKKNDKDFDLKTLTPSFIINGDASPTPDLISPSKKSSTKQAGGEDDLVPDCTLPATTFQENPLDELLLYIFRKLVVKNSNGVAVSDKPGITGLLEQGRTFMVQQNQTAEAQHKMVRDTLAGLMTPALPPFFRIFMSGIAPNRVVRFVKTKILQQDESTLKENEEIQFGPWFYAPYLTTIVTPVFFKFLVGPSVPNARKDGTAGGLIVTKCKFLQESNCKGLCLHQCKLPAQQFFAEELGMPLTVSPNFETQECQWSFGEIPKPVSEDPSFPKGCLVGCESRAAMAGTKMEFDCE